MRGLPRVSVGQRLTWRRKQRGQSGSISAEADTRSASCEALMLQKVIMTMINKEFDDMVCDRCGSDHISINMFFNVWKKSWHADDPHYWCHECNSGDYDYCHVEEYREDDE